MFVHSPSWKRWISSSSPVTFIRAWTSRPFAEIGRVVRRGEVRDVDLVHRDACADADGAGLGRLAVAERAGVGVGLGDEADLARRADRRAVASDVSERDVTIAMPNAARR
jgi:hypothetical protein